MRRFVRYKDSETDGQENLSWKRETAAPKERRKFVSPPSPRRDVSPSDGSSRNSISRRAKRVGFAAREKEFEENGVIPNWGSEKVRESRSSVIDEEIRRSDRSWREYDRQGPQNRIPIQKQYYPDYESRCKLYVSGFNSNTRVSTLKSHFEEWGEVIHCRITRKTQGNSRIHYGIVKYQRAHMVEDAIAAGPHEIDGCEVVPERYNPKERRVGQSTDICDNELQQQWSTFNETRQKNESSSNYQKFKEKHRSSTSNHPSFISKGKDGEVSWIDPICSVCRDLKQLLLSGEESDTTVRVQGQPFRVHRSILVARSPVFASMFRHNMKEKATGVVDLQDCEASAFPVLLEYLYCGDTENFSVDTVFSLYTSADKYDIQELKLECLEFIQNNISTDTFCEAVTLALQHSEANLLKLSVDFFRRNMKKIVKSAKWQAFILDNPIQGNEILIKAMGFDKEDAWSI